MLNYNIQYDIANGVFLTFKNNLEKRSFSVSHGQAKRDKMKLIFPYIRFESMTRENFISLCLYVMVEFSPSSINKMIDILKNIDIQNGLNFKDAIIQYKSNIIKDVLFLREKYSCPTAENTMKEYKRKNIQFYTLWFYYKFLSVDIIEYINKNKINGFYMQRVKQLMLFVTFKQEVIDNIRLLFEESDLISKGFNEED